MSSRSARIVKAALELTRESDSLTTNNVGLESNNCSKPDDPLVQYPINNDIDSLPSTSNVNNGIMTTMTLLKEGPVLCARNDINVNNNNVIVTESTSSLDINFENIQNMDILILESELPIEDASSIFVNASEQSQETIDPNFSSSKEDCSESDADSAISTVGRHDKVNDEEGEHKTIERTRRGRAENKALIQKLNKQKGKSYISKTKRQMAEKTLKPNPCSTKCQNGCGRNFDEHSRQNVFDMYWGLDNAAKRSFLLTCMKESPIARCYVKGERDSRRKRTFCYYLPKDGSKVKVCLQFLLKTLDISHRILSYTFDNKTELQTPKIDKRGNKPPPNKTPEEKTNLVHKFIESLPALPSHYCRSESNRVYLPIEFKNVANIYRIYKSNFCSNERTTPVSEKVFRAIFLNSYNIAIHAPKKEKCSTCESKRDTDDQSASYLSHLHEKKLSMSLFKAHQLRSKRDVSFVWVLFDLQKVHNMPHGESMLLYYSRKYAMYNSGTRNGFCYLWGECDAKRGANEICSNLFSYLKDLDKRVPAITEVSLFCDSCPGQNKNRQVLVMLHFFVQQSKSIQKITMTYLLPGHTYMPADSMHSVIEYNYRRKIIWAPSEWPTIITNSRINPKPYVVNVLTHKDFQDWKTFQENTLSATCQIRSVRQAFLIKNDPKIVLHNTYDKSDIPHVIRINHSKRKSSSTLPLLKTLYPTRLPIMAAKKKNLTDLCKKNIISLRYHKEYLTLPVSNSAVDAIDDEESEDQE